MTGTVLVVSLLLLTGTWLLLEYKTLKDAVPDNHITATVRRAIKKEPGVFAWFMFSLGFLLGHLLWP